jgi:hypothetical protein
MHYIGGRFNAYEVNAPCNFFQIKFRFLCSYYSNVLKHQNRINTANKIRCNLNKNEAA